MMAMLTSERVETCGVICPLVAVINRPPSAPAEADGVLINYFFIC